MNNKLGKNTEIIKDIFTVLRELKKRDDKGVGKQNMKYPPALREFAHVALLTSPQLYRILERTLGRLPAERSIKYVYRLL